MANTTISLLGLDTDSWQQDITNAFQANTTLLDFKWTGAVLSAFTRVLAVNGQKMAFLLNMSISEIYLDSAQLKSSVYSRAKEINYTPRSFSSASTFVNMTIDTGGRLGVINFPKGFRFTGMSGSKALNFTVPTTTTVTSTNGFFTVNNLPIYEGTFLQDSYVVDATDPTQEFLISSPSVDLSSVTVTVTEDQGSTNVSYTRSTSLLDTSSTSTVFWLETRLDKFAVVFGDGTIGQAPQDGSVVTIQYRTSLGDLGNGVQTFRMTQDPTVQNGVSYLISQSVAATGPTTGGTPPQTLDSIRFTAPRYYQTQERCITDQDYEVLLQQQFPEIAAVSSFGGELASPPQFGSVFVAVSITGLDSVPDDRSREYVSFLETRISNGLTPVIIEATKLWLQIVSDVDIDFSLTTLQVSEMETLVTSTILNYAGTELDDFKVSFRASVLSDKINDTDPSIVSNVMKAYLYSEISPKNFIANNYTINLTQPLKSLGTVVSNTHPNWIEHAVWSSQFILGGTPAILEDDGIGNIYVSRPVGNNYMFSSLAGSVDYSSGSITLPQFQVDSYTGPTIQIFGLTANPDITVSNEIILTVDPAQVFVNVVPID